MLINFTREEWETIRSSMVQDYINNSNTYDNPKYVAQIILRMEKVLGIGVSAAAG